MRTIKFRGKSICEDTITTRERKINKSDWVYGSLIVDSQPYIVGEIADVDREFIAPEFWIPVDEKTVGQFTGLHDKNGVEIYEGDRVDFNGSKYFVAIGNYEYQESWDSSHMVFTNGIYFIKIGAYQILNDFNKYNMDYVKVIGNIHEEELK